MMQDDLYELCEDEKSEVSFSSGGEPSEPS